VVTICSRCSTLACEVAAAGRDQALLLVLQPHYVAAQTLEQKMLKVEHAVAVIAGRRPDEP